MDDLHDDGDLLVDWGLHELLRDGDEVPVRGLEHAVWQRWQSAEAAPRPGRGWGMLAAAILAVATVVAVAWAVRARAPLPFVQEPEPEAVVVATVAAAAALPATTRAVEVISGGDEVIAALAHLRDLQLLRVRDPSNESYGLGLKVAGVGHQPRPTADAWRTVVRFSKLRWLEFRGTPQVMRFAKAGVDVGWLAERLAALPLLESVALRFLDTSDDDLRLLDALANLRQLDLSFDHGFGRAGLERIASCRTLSKLTLRGCQQLTGADLAVLGQMTELEELDLGLIDGINWRSGTAAVDAEEAAVLERAHRVADRIGMGPTDDTLRGLARLERLRVLHLDGAHYLTADGMQQLAACGALRELQLFGCRLADPKWLASLPQLATLRVCGDYRDDFCAALARDVPGLRELDVSACYEITDRGVVALAGLRRLRVLELRQMRGLTAQCLDTLVTMSWLEQLDLRHCEFVTPALATRLRAALPPPRRLTFSE
ncbi:MAG: hypothetical protein R3F29_10465 [Planctomycetota bacterium]